MCFVNQFFFSLNFDVCCTSTAFPSVSVYMALSNRIGEFLFQSCTLIIANYNGISKRCFFTIIQTLI